MLIPNALANALWLSPTKRRKAVMSSPDSTLPAISRRRWLARIPRRKSLSLNSGMSLIDSSHVFSIQLLFSSRRAPGADDANRATPSFRPDDDDDPALNGSNGDEAVLV